MPYSMVRPSERDKNNFEKVLRLAISIRAEESTSLPSYPSIGVRTIVQEQRRLSEREVTQVAEQYQAGRSTYQLAGEWKINRSTVTLALKRADVPIRKPRLSARQIEEAVRLRANGWSLNQLGTKFGMDPKTMKQRLAEAPPRPM